ncbi:hypothetical protein [Streptomyces sp. Je 1-369]|uniref:hypothetical protein n=1 Tax=Streptomyces sp. Je 1-369 TaxID=2966192 RepID=UPI002285BA90|nr:hypothetical protein [Streptomyces sp. Je 1-369]WAL93249.1 hypothetical protein NOO62_01335 [Streptomyces sp. Je 1-369]
MAKDKKRDRRQKAIEAARRGNEQHLQSSMDVQAKSAPEARDTIRKDEHEQEDPRSS